MNKLGMLGTLVATAALALGCGEKGKHKVRGPERMDVSLTTTDGRRYDLSLDRWSDHVDIVDSAGNRSYLNFNEGRRIHPGESAVFNNSADRTVIAMLKRYDPVQHFLEFEGKNGASYFAVETNGQATINMEGAGYALVVVDPVKGAIHGDLDGSGGIQDGQKSRIAVTDGFGHSAYITEDDWKLP